MPAITDHLRGIELIRMPVHGVTSSIVRTEMFAWFGFARSCRLLATAMQTKALATMTIENACNSPAYHRAVAYGMMAYEAVDRINVMSKFADELDRIEADEREARVWA